MKRQGPCYQSMWILWSVRGSLCLVPSCSQNRISRPIFFFIVHISDIWHIHCHDWVSREPEKPSQEHKRTPWWCAFLCMTKIPWSDKCIPQKVTLFYQKTSSFGLKTLKPCLPSRKICSAYGLISSCSLWLLWWMEHVRGRVGSRQWAQHGWLLISDGDLAWMLLHSLRGTVSWSSCAHNSCFECGENTTLPWAICISSYCTWYALQICLCIPRAADLQSERFSTTHAPLF
jgi:hypothetical protein